MNAALRLVDLTVSYDRHPAVHHVSAEIPAAEMTAIVGPNGAGQSTLLKALLGHAPSRGTGVREWHPAAAAQASRMASARTLTPQGVPIRCRLRRIRSILMG